MYAFRALEGDRNSHDSGCLPCSPDLRDHDQGEVICHSGGTLNNLFADLRGWRTTELQGDRITGLERISRLKNDKAGRPKKTCRIGRFSLDFKFSRDSRLRCLGRFLVTLDRFARLLGHSATYLLTCEIGALPSYKDTELQA